MKTKTIIYAIVLTISFGFGGHMIFGQNQFKTQDEAIKKAREDFISLIESGIGDFGVTVEQMKNAQVMAAIPYKQVDFSSLVSAREIEYFKEINNNLINYIVPFSVNGRIVAIIQINKMEELWNIAGLGLPAISDELSSLPEEVKKNLKNMIIYDIPNLLTTVYVIQKEEGEVCFSNYDQFSVILGVDAIEMISYLQRRAAEFLEKYGDDLKEKKMYH